MSRLAEIQDQLRDTDAAIAQFKRAMAGSRAPSLEAGLQSIEKRLKRLEQEFLRETEQLGVDVCRYRLFSGEMTRPVASGIFTALNEFQLLFSTVYDAIKSGPKKRTAVSQDVVDESSFGFGYCFSGSVGFVLTIDNQKMLLDSTIDQTMEAVFELARARSKEQVLLSSRTVGSAAIKAMHQWANGHLSAELGADIEWMHGKQLRDRLLLQLPEIDRLTEVLSEANEPSQEEMTVEGVLLGSDLGPPRRFHFRDIEGKEYRGSVTPGVISEGSPVVTPARYSVRLIREFKHIISTGEDSEEKFTLMAFNKLENS